jgi:hypothetical protein
MNKGIELGTAAVQRTDWGEGQMPTLNEAVERVAHLKAPTPVLLEAIAYLACQVNGYRHSQNADANLAMERVQHIVAEYARRTA